MKTIADYIEEVHAINTEKGWNDPPPSDETLRANLIGEVAEVWEAYRSHGLDASKFLYFDGAKPEGIAAELADCFIRWCHWVKVLSGRPGGAAFLRGEYEDHSPGMTIEDAMFNRTLWKREHPPQGKPATFPGDICGLAWVIGDEEDDQSDEWTFHRIIAVAVDYSIDLTAAVEAKLAYNRTRPYRHGGKVA